MINKTKLSLLFLFFLFSSFLMAQSTEELQSAKYVDSVSYKLYSEANWKELISFSNRVITMQTVDFYFFRMRIAYAYFLQGKYRIAVEHYKKASTFDKNPYVKEMILLCYEYTGRKQDALLFSKGFDEFFDPELYQRYNKKVLSFGLSYSFNKADSETASNSLESVSYIATDGVQKASNYYYLPEISLSHRLGKSIIVSHSLSYLLKNETSYTVTDGAAEDLVTHNIYQYNYNISAKITPFLGFSITPSYQWVNYEIPSTEASLETSIIDDIDYASNYGTDYFVNIRLQREAKLFSYGVSYGKGTLNERTQNQYGLHVCYFPKANLDLYFKTDLFGQYEYTDSSNKFTFIHKYKIGTKVIDHLWLELAGTFGNFTDFYDAENAALYNSVERIKSSYGITAIIPLKSNKFQLFLNAKSTQLESSFFDDEDINLNYNKQTYNTLNFSGGLLWKF